MFKDSVKYTKYFILMYIQHKYAKESPVQRLLQ